MSRKSGRRAVRSGKPKSGVRRFGRAHAAAGIAAALVSGWVLVRAVGYVYETPRLEVRSIRFHGLERLSEQEILGQIGYTPGTHMLQIDLDATRAGVESLLWVRSATVQRIWPDELAIAVVERRPIALARIDGEIFQVDSEGVLLSPDASGGAGLEGVDFPVLDGLRPDDLEGNRTKIGVYRSVIEAIGEAELSEVHVSDSGEVSVVPEDSSIVVDLGATEHLDRWNMYLRLRTRIREEYPTASRVDLRFRDQVIIQTQGSQPGGSVVWGEEKKLL